MANIVWTGQQADKLYLQSGEVTSTIKTSQVFSFAGPEDCSFDGTDSFLGDAGGGEKFVKVSGKFTSTLKASLSMGSIDAAMFGMSTDTTSNMVAAGLVTNKHFYLSGQFTTTVKTSINVSGTATSIHGISYDRNGNTPWTSGNTDHLYLNSGQFTSTVKDSENVTTIDTLPSGLSFSGTNTPWIGSTDKKLYIQSGQFTSTLKDSELVSGVDATPRGLETDDFTARTSNPDATGDGAFSLPVLWMNNPNIIQFPILQVQAGGGATGVITLPIMTVVGTGTPADNIGTVTFPLMTVSGTASGPGAFINLPIIVLSTAVIANSVAITLPLMTVSAEKFIRCNGDITLPRPTFFNVVQQGSVENISITLPGLALNAFSGIPVAITLPNLSLNAVGQSGIVGSYDRLLPRMTVSSQAKQEILGTFNVTLPSFSLDNNLLTGIVSLASTRNLPVLTLNAHAFRGENGDGAITLPTLTLSTLVALNPNGTFAQSLKMLTLDAYADVHINRII